MASTSITAQRPLADEHDPYYSRYIALVPEGEIVSTLRNQISDTLSMLKGLPESKGDFRYAPGKWTIKEVLGHLSDSERVFAYRALRIARNDQTPLSGFEQDDYVRFGRFNHVALGELIDGYATIRESTVRLLKSLNDEAWARRGTANGAGVSVRALAYIIAGHELHHRRILTENYGV